MNAKNITNMIDGQEITINKHGETIITTFKSYRELTVRTRTATFEIRTGAGMIYAGFNGEPVHYNDYSTSIIVIK
jgi:hypothetical protein